MYRKFLIFISFLLAGCEATPYKKADLSDYSGLTGYLDKQITSGHYILEYSHIGGFDYNLDRNVGFWKKRALELCPNGYKGSYEVVHPANAKIEDFVCPMRFCGDYPLVTGVIQCQ